MTRSDQYVFEKTPWGRRARHQKIEVFFGGKMASEQLIAEKFPQLTFLKVKQTHSNICRLASVEIHEADAHWTADQNKALMILTADCMPIMIYCLQTQRVAAVHAGWRGVANQIIVSTLCQLIESGSYQKQFIFWIGPHISQNSFEVQKDCLDLLEKAVYELNDRDYLSVYDNKMYVNLFIIVEAQIKKTIGCQPIIHSVAEDTFSNSEFFSYRRERQTSGRNLSFIVKHG
jgi:hypothetical protein